MYNKHTNTCSKKRTGDDAMMEDIERMLYTVKEISEILNTSESLIYKMVSSKLISSIKINNRLYVLGSNCQMIKPSRK